MLINPEALAPTLPSFNEKIPLASRPTIYASKWGFDRSMDVFIEEAKALGYDGVEVWCPQDLQERDALRDACERSNMHLALLAGAGADNFEEHLSEYRSNLQNAVAMNPHFINCHAGRDYFTFGQNKSIIELANMMSGTSGIPIFQETHRSRMLFAAHVCHVFIEKIEKLRLTLDISHWCNVHESLLGNQPEAVEAALKRTDHIHARVGHPEGPQISHPDVPEWKDAVHAHFQWWDEVVRIKSALNQPISITPEFGPPDYMPRIPFTGEPIADNWKVNARMLELLRERYG